jgi:hypothetical protein
MKGIFSAATTVLVVAIAVRAQEPPIGVGSCGVTKERGEVCQLGGLQKAPGTLQKMIGPKLATIKYNVASGAKLELPANQDNSIIVFLTDSRVQLKQGTSMRVFAGQVMSLPHDTSLSIENPDAIPIRFVLIRGFKSAAP